MIKVDNTALDPYSFFPQFVKIDLNKMMTLSCQNSFSDFASRFDTTFQAVTTCYKKSKLRKIFEVPIRIVCDLILDLKTLLCLGLRVGQFENHRIVGMVILHRFDQIRPPTKAISNSNFLTLSLKTYSFLKLALPKT